MSWTYTQAQFSKDKVGFFSQNLNKTKLNTFSNFSEWIAKTFVSKMYAKFYIFLTPWPTLLCIKGRILTVLYFDGGKQSIKTIFVFSIFLFYSVCSEW